MSKRILNSNGVKNRIQKYLNDRVTGDQLFLLAFTIFLISESLTTTMFSVPGKIHLLCKGIAVLLILVKMLLFDHYRSKELWAMVITIALGAGIMAVSGYMEPLMWFIMVWGAKDVPWKKILKMYLIVAVIIVLLAFCASMLDVIENLQYTRGDGKRLRNSFGAMYTTDFASHIFSIFLVGFYLLKERLRLWHYVCGIVVAGAVFWFCDTRVDVACLCALILTFAVLNVWKKRPSLSKKYHGCAKAANRWCWFMPVAALIMFGVTLLYSKNRSLLVALNSVMSNRLNFGNVALKKYGIAPLGQYVEMVGNGGTTVQAEDYFFVDCSYLYVALRYGWVFLLIVLGVYVLCCKKFSKDIYFIVSVVLIGINCMIAHHLIELAYIPFALALFANVAEDIGISHETYRKE